MQMLESKFQNTMQSDDRDGSDLAVVDDKCNGVDGGISLTFWNVCNFTAGNINFNGILCLYYNIRQ